MASSSSGGAGGGWNRLAYAGGASEGIEETNNTLSTNLPPWAPSPVCVRGGRGSGWKRTDCFLSFLFLFSCLLDWADACVCLLYVRICASLIPVPRVISSPLSHPSLPPAPPPPSSPAHPAPPCFLFPSHSRFIPPSFLLSSSSPFS